jgi:hypothetical protein
MQGSQEGFQMVNDQSDFNYWHDRMKSDAQFIQFMTEMYKKQQLDLHMTHHPRSSSATRIIPQLMDQPISSSPIQQQQQYGQIRTTKTSTVRPKAPSNNQESSTPRRPLDESGSENQYHRQVKKSRPYERTPSTHPPPFTASFPTRQFRFSQYHLKHAVSNNLPCFHIKLDDNTGKLQIPSLMNVARWIRQTVQEQSSQLIDDFSLFIPAGNNRFKFGVTSKNDFLKLWNCKWPEKMDQIKVEIERPRSLPDCCALVVRYVPIELANEFVVKEVAKSIRSSVAFTKMNYNRPRPTNDFRFCVTDPNEYEEILNIGRIAIGHLLLPVTAFLPGLKMTYCTNCWELGHIRSECKVGPRCRKCLETWEYNHKCQKPLLCAQCQGPHSSLSMECLVVKNYRRTLKDEVNNAVKNGLIRQVEVGGKPETVHQMVSDFPTLKPANGTQQAWGYKSGPLNDAQKPYEKEQLSELKTQINDLLDISRRTEIKIDNQIDKMEMIDKKSSINKQAIMVLVNIMEHTINALLEKKNKQHLQNLSHQIEQFKNDIMEKFDAITADQQSPPNSSASFHPNNNNNKITIKSTTSIDNTNNNQVELEHSMETTNG